MTRSVNRVRAIHPGEVLREDFLIPAGISINALALALGVPATRIHEIVKERRAVTADAASWLALQASYDLKTLLPTLDEIERRVQRRETLV